MLNLSVIIPNYNHAKYLPEALHAILSQTHQPIEVLVVDDASTDESCKVVREFQKKYDHLSLLRFDENSGSPIEPIKKGLAKVQGEYVALCASDDIIQPHFFQDAMEMIRQNPQVGICFGDFCTFKDVKPYQMEHLSLFRMVKPQVFTPDELVEICRKSPFYIPSQTTIYKKELVLKYGSYNPKLESLADYYLNCQIAFQNPVAYIPKAMGAYRIRDDSYAQSQRFNLKKRKETSTALMQQIMSEDKSFQDRLRRSGILAHAGIYVIAYLACRPRYWNYVPASFLKRFIYSR